MVNCEVGVVNLAVKVSIGFICFAKLLRTSDSELATRAVLVLVELRRCGAAQ
jgi:hypothetical protein